MWLQGLILTWARGRRVWVRQTFRDQRGKIRKTFKGETALYNFKFYDP